MKIKVYVVLHDGNLFSIYRNIESAKADAYWKDKDVNEKRIHEAELSYNVESVNLFT